MSNTFGQSTVLGYPRIGANRELKKAVEAYWAGKIGAAELENTAAGLRAEVWQQLRNARLDAIPSNTFSYYDHVLDTAVAVGAIPARFTRLGFSGLNTYFAMARGVDAEPALELTKWFATNYHYLVPEIDADTTFTPDPAKPLAEYAEAKALGIETRPVLVGPATFLLLAKGTDPFARLDELVEVYATILNCLADAGVAWVQLDEPAYVADRTLDELDALQRVYTRLGELEHRPKIFVATYFGELGDALPVLLTAPIEAIGVDLVAGPGNLARLIAAGPLGNKTIVAGLVDGHNIWRTDLRAAITTGAAVTALADHVAVSTSCSLLHVPVDLSVETRLAPELFERLAFARQKVDEVVLLGKALRDGTAHVPAPLPAAPAAWRNDDVRARLAALTPADRQRGDYEQRATAQQARLNLPELPTTTIGSFPQTAELRKARAELRAGTLDADGYTERMRSEVEHVIRLQERLGLDVLVHGEPERNDMVQYFGEQLDGFAATDHGWVQSYGSRCVRPPIIYGDVARKTPMTVPWSTFAQSLTAKPVKGMLTGPVTILAWSFVRTDQPLADTADQVGLALRDETTDLQAAGITVIQVDEPALRETLPLRKAAQKAYLDWAVGAFRLATSGVADDTQIHTHLCYSEFGEVITAIDALDADVTSIEASRSKMEVLDDLAAIGYSRGVGPGVWDIHSPRVPSQDEVTESLRRAVGAVPARRLWVNPDCGLKTRGYPETEASLKHLVAAAAAVRGQ
ncbi:5-methyltetrahydropteroyltriglutamate--homocysteine S-methyltransferase [Actinoplanes couchii]|uniref:5-methyltetrahydropteroyltriglutamate--homocysteine methyltransferase n=1 Tax=Actinoplanes couchii TaxID=403638 RepID=A0ABQ3XL87_9ACTN|nr:5-methyltetrahydropteroyltriglutamate--homocysteine S-methyltransferase [Actinoplanes couchii]MDR6318371.1 5-methyltetrahydropteroyltriglutamate--homocysteine methyltransferase [Actinoplanes couchii]GID59261.1 5-methyltetrahydropteroyltriglutamate--homocysteine methyltransferase [Actinoplanes couchii]